MAIVLSSLHFLIVLYVSTVSLAFAQNENQFIYNGFSQAKLHLDGGAKIRRSGLLQLTNSETDKIGHAFYQFPIKFKSNSSNSTSSVSFSTNFVFAMVPKHQNLGGHGIAFTISPSTDFTRALAGRYLGLFSSSNEGLPINHILAIELNPIHDDEAGNVTNNNDVGIDVNNNRSIESAPAMYYERGDKINLKLISGNPMNLWIDYDEAEKLLNVTISPTKIPKPGQPLLSKTINLSGILLEDMYVGFSSTTGLISSHHYILGWSFNTSGPAQSLDIASLPHLPEGRKKEEKPGVLAVTLQLAAAVVLIMVPGAVYILRQKKYEEVREDWEEGCGPHRFSYKDLYKATRGFKDTELLGAGGFGNVYRGILCSSNIPIAVKKVSHDSKQGMKEFVAEIISNGRLRHRNLVPLLGYCRGKGELLLVYDYMPNGSLDQFLYSNENSNLNWLQRFQIIRGVACGLLYLHEEWEQVVLHRDVKASNVLLDAEFNARLGDFGLAKLYEHGGNPQTTHVVGTVGYLAPELARTGRATTCTDVFAFGAFMLEVACGRRPIELLGPPEQVILVEWVYDCCRKEAILDASDPRLEGNYVVDEMVLVLKLGLLCSQAKQTARPSMRQVMQFLDGDAHLPDIAYESASFHESTSFSSSNLLLTSPFPPDSAVSKSNTDSIVQVVVESSMVRPNDESVLGTKSATVT